MFRKTLISSILVITLCIGLQFSGGEKEFLALHK
ncbi:hypothetical protein J2S11_001503 [Bacillus horti]|uniref:Uncharacterized protein n=1 Tax=Caldalkalibacillus horti TaxID=77523 RepID=A0ABT9VXR7_9BACI|nr:hypothetical protein [Bacillus horti]